MIYVAAVALTNQQGEILLVQRPAGKQMAGLWEFPGGKIESHESPEQALQRELKEELNLTVDLDDLVHLCFVSHPYPDFHLVMLIYTCHQWQGDVEMLENQEDFAWVARDDLKAYPMPPADLPVVEILCNLASLR
ncbi:8-oxo-dGTP diphosphatase MutT [Candidatus Finniella inopinata]|uniref:8-oxo-dGTP diphosphatase n=2 Tax=Candidatus Finniella inopinata TaxID=1696036 RepID=A0A4Q7DJZ7_9PROT|nr:8-oxo-dGTP diphosphatase MutT [Candidatus Finniella inopinata]